MFSPTVPEENAHGPSELDVVSVRDGQRSGGWLRAGRAQGHREAAQGADAAVRCAHRWSPAADAGPGASHEGMCSIRLKITMTGQGQSILGRVKSRLETAEGAVAAIR